MIAFLGRFLFPRRRGLSKFPFKVGNKWTVKHSTLFSHLGVLGEKTITIANNFFFFFPQQTRKRIPKMFGLDDFLINDAKLTLTSFPFRWWWWWSSFFFVSFLICAEIFRKTHTTTRREGKESLGNVPDWSNRTSGSKAWIYTHTTESCRPYRRVSALTVYYYYYTIH